MSLGNVHLTPQLVQAVRDAADIVAIASEHTRLKQAGRRWHGLCPLHKEKSPSFSVDPDQGLFYCFGCGKGGDAIKLHMLLTGDDFPVAIENLAQRHGIPLPSRHEPRIGGRDAQGVVKALEAAAAFFTAELKKTELPRKYLEERRIPVPLRERFGLGYAPDSWDQLLIALRSKIALADLEAAGLVGRSERSGKPYDRFRHRLIFPILSPAGRLVGFGGRTLGDDKAKYVNTSETEQFHKGRLLYGLFQAKTAMRESGSAVLVEGYFDVLGAVACGAETAVAGMGTALTPEQAHLLARYAEEVVVAYDGDNAGESAYRRALPLLLAEGFRVRRARFPAGHDPDSLRLAEGEEAVREAIEKAPDAILLEMDRLIPQDVQRSPQATADAGAAVRELVAAVPDAVARHHYLRRAAERLQVPEKLFLAQLAQRGPGTPAATGPAAISSSRAAPVSGLVRTWEESVLNLLLRGQKIPPAEDLPEAEVFVDPQCRNIYRTFRALYKSGGAGVLPPDSRAVLAQLGESEAVDRMAQILVETPVGSKELELPDLLAKLNDRYDRQRLQKLAGEIAEAKRRGADPETLTRLAEQKQELSLRLQNLPRARKGRAGTV